MLSAKIFEKPTALVLDCASRWGARFAHHAASLWIDLGWRARRTWVEARRRTRMHAHAAARRAAQLTSAMRAQLSGSDAGLIVLASASIAALAYAFAASWTSAVHAGALGFIAASLLSVQATQRRQAALLQGQLDELRQLLHVTEAVLDADDDADDLEGLDEAEEVTVARSPELELRRSPGGSLLTRIRHFGRRLRH
jgi:hypothetical protein